MGVGPGPLHVGVEPNAEAGCLGHPETPIHRDGLVQQGGENIGTISSAVSCIIRREPTGCAMAPGSLLGLHLAC